MSGWPSNRNGGSDAFGDGMDSSGNSELAAVGRAVRAVYVREPAPEVAEAHIAAILAEAERVVAEGADRAAAAPTRSRWFGRRGALTIRLAAVVASAFVASAGLAIAGVRPPEPFSDLFEGLGFNVPGSDQSSADEQGPPTGEGSEADDRGGSESAPETSARDGSPQASGGDSDAIRGEQRSDEGAEASFEGQETAADAQAGSTSPSQPGRSEDQPDLSVDPTSQGGSGSSDAPAGNQGAPGDPPVEDQSGGGGPPEVPPAGPMDDPEAGAPGQSGRADDAAPGLSVSEEHRPVEPPEDRSGDRAPANPAAPERS